ncbi:MAG: helix-turn-helix domain-containing protein [Limnohabitans sp.]
MNPADSFEMQPEQAVRSPSAGQMLRAAREARGMHLAMLSVNLKVSVRQLEALEADQYDAFKGITFVRALAQSVCRHLKTDPAPVLQALPRGDAPQALQPVALEAHRTTVVTDSQPGTGIAMSRQVLLLAVLMLAVAGALIWWPGSRPDALRMVEKIQDTTPVAVPMGQAASDAIEAVPAMAPPPPTPAATASVAVLAVSPKPQAAASLPLPTVATPVVSPVPVASQGPVAPKETPLVIKVSADTWISVRDNHGQTAIRRQVRAGETVNLDLAAPLFVYAGRAEGVELSWRGKPVDLKPHTQNNEVRLQIKP